MILDTALFVAILAASNPAWTGIGLHEWLAGLIMVPALYHLAINWDWIVHVSAKLVAKLKTISRINFMVDITLFVATVTVMVSGFMVLPGAVSLDYGTVILETWLHVHAISSDVTIAAMVIHLILHAQWISDAATRVFLPKPGRHSIGRNAAFARDRGRR